MKFSLNFRREISETIFDLGNIVGESESSITTACTSLELRNINGRVNENQIFGTEIKNKEE